MPCPSKAWAMGSPTPPWPTSTAWSRRACSSTVWGSSDRDPAGRSISAAMRGCCRSHRSSGPTVLKIRGLAVIDSSAARMRLTASDDSRSSERPRVARMKENSPIWARLAATISALIVAASLAQIGEFSFILATLGRSLDLLSSEAVSLILAALLSITANPLIFSTVGPLERWLRQHPRMAALIERPAGSLSELPQTVDEHALRDHAVLVGHGGVGEPIAQAFEGQGIPYVVVEQNREVVEALQEPRLPVVSEEDAFEARRIIEHAKRVTPSIDTLVRTHSDVQRAELEQMGVGRAVVAERELALAVVRYAFAVFGVEQDMSDVAAQTLQMENPHTGKRTDPHADTEALDGSPGVETH